jgi:signal transduction histidine kinase
VRAKLSRELHDQIGQELVILRRKAQSLVEESREESLRKKAGELVILSDQLMDSVHNLSVELRPMMLDELGLEKAIQWYAEDFERRTGIRCVFILTWTTSVIYLSGKKSRFQPTGYSRKL